MVPIYYTIWKWNTMHGTKVSIIYNFPNQKFICQDNIIHKSNLLYFSGTKQQQLKKKKKKKKRREYILHGNIVADGLRFSTLKETLHSSFSLLFIYFILFFFWFYFVVGSNGNCRNNNSVVSC